MAIQKDKLSNYIDSLDNCQLVDELSTDAQTLFGLLTLIVDIKYRVKYGSTFGEQVDKRYSEDTMKKVVADQITPVDNGLLRH